MLFEVTRTVLDADGSRECCTFGALERYDMEEEYMFVGSYMKGVR